MNECNRRCHEVERWWIKTELEVILITVLDGDDVQINAILNAIDQLPEAA